MVNRILLLRSLRLACILLVGGGVFLPAPSLAQTIHIAAIVNDDVITTNDIAERRALIINTNHLPDTVETQQKITPRILESLITERLELQEAKRLSIEVSDAELNDAYNKIDAARHQSPGTTQHFLAANPRFKRSVENQIRAQLSWNKVIERKIKRTINIADDEITRAQIAEAAGPGVPEVRIAAISIPIHSKADEGHAAKLARDLSDKLNHGADFITLAKQLAGTNQAQLNPPVWVPESELQPAMQQALRSLQPKQITEPLRSQNSFQLITLLDRRFSKPVSDKTEVALKQISIPLASTTDPKTLEAARSLARLLHQNPGSCDDTKLDPAANGKATASFIRATYGDMSPELKGVIAHVQVGEVTDPLLGDHDVKLMLVCERIEAPPSLPPAAEIKHKLFNEKLELESEKYLRNLRRDAYIDIKGEQ